MDGRPLEDAAVEGVEARAVARAVPAALRVVEAHLAAEVRARRAEGVQRAGVVAEGGRAVTAVAGDRSLPGRDLLGGDRAGQPVADEVPGDVEVLLDELGARGQRVEAVG